MNEFVLLRFEKEENFIDEVPLKGATAADVKKNFPNEIQPEYPGDFVRISEEHLDWLRTLVESKIEFKLAEYDYFVSIM